MLFYDHLKAERILSAVQRLSFVQSRVKVYEVDFANGDWADKGTGSFSIADIDTASPRLVIHEEASRMTNSSGAVDSSVSVLDECTTPIRRTIVDTPLRSNVDYKFRADACLSFAMAANNLHASRHFALSFQEASGAAAVWGYVCLTAWDMIGDEEQDDDCDDDEDDDGYSEDGDANVQHDDNHSHTDGCDMSLCTGNKISTHSYNSDTITSDAHALSSLPSTTHTNTNGTIPLHGENNSNILSTPTDIHTDNGNSKRRAG
eukprot:Lankesteria_metandrocarpae@DN9758_c0_g1_i1.p1